MQHATEAQKLSVDTLLLASCSAEWRKVATVVGRCLTKFEAACPELPYVYMQVRLLELVEAGALEARGDVMQVRFSEIRLRPRET